MPGVPQLVGVPYDASSSFERGSAAAPPLIRKALHSLAGNSDAESGADLSQLADAGDLVLPDDATEAAIQAGIERSLTSGFQPIALGGNHSITLPIMRAIAKQHPAVTILHIDAHRRLFADVEGDRVSRARLFARIMDERLGARLVQVSIRTLTPDQLDQIARFGAETIEGPVYVSVDLDGINPAFAHSVLTMIQRLDGPIVGADVVEFNPSADVGGVTASVAAKIVREIAGRILVT